MRTGNRGTPSWLSAAAVVAFAAAACDDRPRQDVEGALGGEPDREAPLHDRSGKARPERPDVEAIRSELEDLRHRVAALREDRRSAGGEEDRGDRAGAPPPRADGPRGAAGQTAEDSSLAALCEDVLARRTSAKRVRQEGRSARRPERQEAKRRSPESAHASAEPRKTAQESSPARPPLEELEHEIEELDRAVAALSAELGVGEARALRSSPRTSEVEGRVASAAPDRMLVRAPGGTLVLLRLGETTKVTHDGERMQRSALEEGMEVRARYEIVHGEQRASEVEVKKK